MACCRFQGIDHPTALDRRSPDEGGGACQPPERGCPRSQRDHVVDSKSVQDGFEIEIESDKRFVFEKKDRAWQRRSFNERKQQAYTPGSYHANEFCLQGGLSRIRYKATTERRFERRVKKSVEDVGNIRKTV